MAQNSSFDIVSHVDLQEVDNAINQAGKEIGQRYDFKGLNTTIDFDQKEKVITVSASDDFHLKSAVDILQSKLVKRGVHLKALKYNPPETAARSSVRQRIQLRVGIEKEDAKRIVAMIKDQKLKVQAQIMDDQVRVTGRDKDDLQTVIAALRAADLPFAMQFVNYR